MLSVCQELTLREKRQLFFSQLFIPFLPIPLSIARDTLAGE
jgi:hypothetical protein